MEENDYKNNPFDFLNKLLKDVLQYSTDNFSKDIKDCFIYHLTPHVISYLLTKITKQPFIKDPEYTIYKQTFIDSNELETITNTNSLYSIYPIIFNIIDDSIILQIISVEILIKFIMVMDEKFRYIFLPIYYECEINDVSHLAVLVIDKIELEVYLLDPNGNPSFFNKITHINIIDNIESMLKNYFEIVNLYGYEFKFVATTKWNSDKFYINKSFKNKNVGSGHCGIMMIMLCQMVIELNKKPCEIFNLLKKLCDDELLYFITQYYCGLYNILKNNDKLKQEDSFLTFHKYFTLLNDNSNVKISGFIDNMYKQNPSFKNLNDINTYLAEFI